MHLTFGGRYISASKIFLETMEEKKSQGTRSGELGEWFRT